MNPLQALAEKWREREADLTIEIDKWESALRRRND